MILYWKTWAMEQKFHVLMNAAPQTSVCPWRRIGQFLISYSIPFPIIYSNTRIWCVCLWRAFVSTLCVFYIGGCVSKIYRRSKQKQTLELERAGKANIKWIIKFQFSSLAIQVHKLKSVSLMKYSHLHTFELMFFVLRFLFFFLGVWHSFFFIHVWRFFFGLSAGKFVILKNGSSKWLLACHNGWHLFTYH